MSDLPPVPEDEPITERDFELPAEHPDTSPVMSPEPDEEPAP